MKIILIGNKAQHGKDTFANMLQKELEARDNSCSIIHFADCLKFVCKEFFDWDGPDRQNRSAHNPSALPLPQPVHHSHRTGKHPGSSDSGNILR